MTTEELQKLEKLEKLPEDRRNRIAVDLDGTLSEKALFPDIWNLTPRDLLKEHATVKPRKDIIEKVNDFYNRGWIVFIYTARSDLYERITKKWLDKHKVKYHYIIMNKPYFDIMVDDKALKPEEEWTT